jgi:predicted AAA+ superfamily ATPase
MNTEIRRDSYLDQLLLRRNNGLIKVVTGLRRSGKSYLLRTLFKNHLLNEGVPQDHIIEMAFDLFDNQEYLDPKVFYPWVLSRIKDGGQYYILLDEIQLMQKFVSVLNGLADRKNCDVYVTGSNAKFLSKDIATEFGGRGDEVHMHPLSFAEFMTVYQGHYYDGFKEYMIFGGIPAVVLAKTPEQKMALLDSLFAETYIRDIKIRNKLRNVDEMGTLLDILSSSVGSLTNPNKLCNTFRSVNRSKITATTITKYIGYLEDSFLIEEARRYDIRGKSYIGTPQKYYFTDLGLRNARIGYRQTEFPHSMENIIYNELRSRGFKVDVGNLSITEQDKNQKPVKKQLEVDFICRKASRKYYIQSAYLLETPEKTQQEIRPFLRINDSFKKIVITSDTPAPFYTEDGILMMSVYDFLRDSRSLDF